MNQSFSLALVWASFLIGLPVCQAREVQIIQPRPEFRRSDVKLNQEAELFFFTESLGFANDKFMQVSTAWHTFLVKFLQTYKYGSEAFDTKITKQYLMKNSSILCPVYLSDPIFSENNIFPYPLEDEYAIRYEQKQLKFQYFSKSPEAIKVIRCPVLIDQFLSHLYFQEVYGTWTDLTNAQNVLRAYFVLASDVINNADSEIQPLNIVMFTVYYSQLLPYILRTGEEAEIIPFETPPTPTLAINFTIGSHQSTEANGLRLFGERAELFFLAKTYGFFNYDFNAYWRVKELILILERMKKGFEIDYEKMQDEKDTTEESSLCITYVKNNYYLMLINIAPVPRIEDLQINWVTKLVQFPATGILQHGREREILECPVISVKNRQICNIYLLPIHYKRNKLPQIIVFMNNENNQGNDVYPYQTSAFYDIFFRNHPITDIPNYERGQDESETDE